MTTKAIKSAVLATAAVAAAVFAVPSAGAAGAAAGLTIEPSTSGAGVTFLAQAVGLGANLTYSWSFGDGTTVTTVVPTVTHAYRAGGLYSVTLVETSPTGLQARAAGKLDVRLCSTTAQSCQAAVRSVSGMQLASALGPLAGGGPAQVDVLVAPYQFANCPNTFGAAAGVVDTGLTRAATITVKYIDTDPNSQRVTCFASTVPFLDTSGALTTSGPLPSCTATQGSVPCVESVTKTRTAAGLLVTKVLLVPPGDPGTGAH